MRYTSKAFKGAVIGLLASAVVVGWRWQRDARRNYEARVAEMEALNATQ